MNPVLYYAILCLGWVVTAVSSDSLDLKVGHLEKFGSQRPPELETVELHTVPHPREFWEKFVKPRKPVLFRGAAKHSRAFHLWTEEYLASEYANFTVRLESRHEDNGRIPAGVDGILGRDTVEHFITNYQTMDAYVISQIPEPMEQDVSVPPCLRCGSFVDSMQEVHLFMSAGGGKTIIHRDPYSTMHCVFNGTKDWLLIGQNQTQLLYQSEDSSKELGGYSVINVDAVDLNHHPLISEVKYSKITMYKGDCLFVPGGIWHQVRSRGYMNTAVSMWFSRLYEFDDKDCDTADIRYTPMNEIPILWRFSGHGTLPQGHMDIHFVKKLFLTSVNSEGRLALRPFVDYYFTTMADNKKEILDKDIKERGERLKEYLDPSNRGYITKEEIEGFDIDKMKEIILFFDPTDVSNMEDLEYSHIESEAIIDALIECLNSEGHFDKKKFILSYTEELGGTPAKAYEIIENLKPGNVSVMTHDELLKRTSVALHKYTSALKHDPSFEHKMLEHLSKHQHDEL